MSSYSILYNRLIKLNELISKLTAKNETLESVSRNDDMIYFSTLEKSIDEAISFILFYIGFSKIHLNTVTCLKRIVSTLNVKSNI